MAPHQAHIRLIGLMAALTMLTVGFHQLGSNPAFEFEWSLHWLDRADPEIAMAALLRIAGLAICYWMLVSTALYALTQRTGGTPPVLRRITVPLVRRIVDRSLAASLAISMLAVPGQPLLAAAEKEPAIVLEIHGDGIPVPHLRLEPASTGTTDRAGPRAAASATITPPPRSAAAGTATSPATHGQPPAADTYTVVSGDNLWLIAESQVGLAEDGPPTERKVAAYWRALIDSNLANLRSGDSNLIYPGEILSLPKHGVQP